MFMLYAVYPSPATIFSHIKRFAQSAKPKNENDEDEDDGDEDRDSVI